MLYEVSCIAHLGDKEFIKTDDQGQVGVTYIRPKVTGLGLKGP